MASFGMRSLQRHERAMTEPWRLGASLAEREGNEGDLKRERPSTLDSKVRTTVVLLRAR